MSKAKHRILIVDDDALVVKSLRLLLETEGYAVSAAFSGREGMRRAYEDRPDLILLDVMLPDLNGFQVLERLRDQADIPIIMVTAISGAEQKAQGLDGGAVDWITKPFDIQDLLARIRRSLRGAQTGQKPRDLLVADSHLHIDFGAHRALVQGDRINLTPIEWRLLRRLVSAEGEVVTFEDLLQAGWDNPDWRDQHSIKVRISQIRKKIRDNARKPNYIYTERQVGYCFTRHRGPESGSVSLHNPLVKE